MTSNNTITGKLVLLYTGYGPQIVEINNDLDVIDSVTFRKQIFFKTYITQLLFRTYITQIRFTNIYYK